MIFTENKTLIEKAREIADFYAIERKAYMAVLEKTDDFYRGNLLKYIPKVGEETPQRWAKRPKLVTNYVKPIADKRASVYETPAKRTISDNSEVEKVMGEVWEQTGGTFQQIDLQCELSGYSCVKIVYDETKDTIRYKPISARYVFPYINNETSYPTVFANSNLFEKIILRYQTEVKKII